MRSWPYYTSCIGVVIVGAIGGAAVESTLPSASASVAHHRRPCHHRHMTSGIQNGQIPVPFNQQRIEAPVRFNLAPSGYGYVLPRTPIQSSPPYATQQRCITRLSIPMEWVFSTLFPIANEGSLVLDLYIGGIVVASIQPEIYFALTAPTSGTHIYYAVATAEFQNPIPVNHGQPIEIGAHGVAPGLVEANNKEGIVGMRLNAIRLQEESGPSAGSITYIDEPL